MNTWQVPVKKRLEQSTLNFAQLCLTGRAEQKRVGVFSNNLLFIFYGNNLTSFESLFCMKTISRLFKKYLKSIKSRTRFCFSLGWLRTSGNKSLETAILLAQELIKYKK